MIETALVLPSPRALLPWLSDDDPVPELRAACAAAVGEAARRRPEHRRAWPRRSARPTWRAVSPSRSVTGSPGTCSGTEFEAQLALPCTAAPLLEARAPRPRPPARDGRRLGLPGREGARPPAPGRGRLRRRDRARPARRRRRGAGDSIDPDQAAELWCEGAPGFHVLAEVARGREGSREVSYADAPYGVAWWVARWDLT